AAGVMATALAHELNQPLTATATAVRAAQRMLRRAAPSEVAPHMEQALDLAFEQSLLAGQIIRGLRDFVERGGETEKTIERIPDLVAEASALALAGTRDLGVRVANEIPPDLPPVLVDRVQIQQVLFNLLRNA